MIFVTNKTGLEEGCIGSSMIGFIYREPTQISKTKRNDTLYTIPLWVQLYPIYITIIIIKLLSTSASFQNERHTHSVDAHIHVSVDECCRIAFMYPRYRPSIVHLCRIICTDARTTTRQIYLAQGAFVASSPSFPLLGTFAASPLSTTD